MIFAYNTYGKDNALISASAPKRKLISPSTLLNAGRTTNFIYEVKGISQTAAQEFNEFLSFQEKFDFLKARFRLQFVDMENAVFKNNLILIDSDLPVILAQALLLYYGGEISRVADAVDCLTKLNPLGYDMAYHQPFYLCKMKKFLADCALGLLPAKIWDGQEDANGGYIIVREDGEVLCFHLFNRNEFQNYLLSCTRFETASTKRNDFGSIYLKNGKHYLKLNLQIRFTK